MVDICNDLKLFINNKQSNFKLKNVLYSLISVLLINFILSNKCSYNKYENSMGCELCSNIIPGCLRCVTFGTKTHCLECLSGHSPRDNTKDDMFISSCDADLTYEDKYSLNGILDSFDSDTSKTVYQCNSIIFIKHIYILNIFVIDINSYLLGKYSNKQSKSRSI